MTPVTVIIRAADGVETQRKHVDHDNREDRQWMGKASFWAVRHDHSMLSVPGHVGKQHFIGQSVLTRQPA